MPIRQACCGLLALVAVVPAMPAAAAVQLPTDFVNETVVSGLTQPTSMALLPDGRILFVEQRTGSVRLVVNDSIGPQDPVFVLPDVNIVGFERGVQSLALHPQWPLYPFVYFSYTRTGGRFRLVRYSMWGEYEAGGDTLHLVNPVLILDTIEDADPRHNGGGLRFGPDGYLYLSLGDDQDDCAAADSSSLKGAILRLDVSQLPLISDSLEVPRALIIPPDNPFAAGADSNAALVWAYGLRNPWRFHIDPVLGDVYSSDVGEISYEEVNAVDPGDFLGWPYREGPLVRDRPACPEPGGTGANFYPAPIVALQRTGPPASILTASMYRPPVGGNAKWPGEYYGFYGDLFYSDYYVGHLRRLKRQSGVWNPAAPVAGQPSPENWATGLTWPVDFLIDRQGSLLWLSQFDASGAGATGSIQRIRYAPPVGVPPPALARGALSARPNPFRSKSDIVFSVEAAGSASLEVFDVSGRRVRTLHEGHLEAGGHRLTWDGRDARGLAVAPGVYLARLTRESSTQTTRLLRIE